MIIQSIDRAQQILSLFSFDRPKLGIQEIADELGLGKGTAHNIVKTLCLGGLLKQDPNTRKYTLGTKLFALGMIVSGTLDINQKARPLMRQLAQKTNLVCRLAIWDQDAALITMEIEPGLSDSISIQIGPRINAYCTAIGRALLAHLPEPDLETYLNKVELLPFTQNTIKDKANLMKELEVTKSRGYAINNQEISLGRASIATAVFKNGGDLAASISLSATPKKLLNDNLENHLENLWETARAISQSMGYFR